MDRVVKDLHLGRRPVISRAFRGLRRRGYIVLADASLASLYWVNGNCLTAYQLVALAVMRGMPVKNDAEGTGNIARGRHMMRDQPPKRKRSP
jgi:hypothetical protein